MLRLWEEPGGQLVSALPGLRSAGTVNWSPYMWLFCVVWAPSQHGIGC